MAYVKVYWGNISGAASQGISPTGIASTLAFGSPTLTPGDVSILATGIASTLAFGSLEIATTQTILPNGIASTVAFGSPTFSQYLSIYPKSINPTTRFGNFQALYIPKPDVPPIAVREVEFTDSILKLTVKEVYRGRPFFDLLQKVANHVVVEVVEDEIPGAIKIIREGFLAELGSRYAIKETGSGLLIGLFKSNNGVMKFISPGLPSEIRILVGQKGVEMVPPKGWEIVGDADIQARYNSGNSPNWIAAAIRYVGI